MNRTEITVRYKDLPRTAKISIWLGIGLIVYSAIGFLAVPALTKYLLQTKLSQVVHRPVHAEKVYFNPFTLDMKIKGFEIGEGGKQSQLAAARELEVNLQAVSIFKRALILSAIRITGPKVYISQDKKGVFNFQDILQESPEKGPEEESRPFLFSLNNIQITDGAVTFRDDLKGVTHKITDLRVGVPFISNLKTRIRIYTKPYFSAVINGAPVEFKGQTRPFARDHSTRLHINLADLDLAHYLAYMSDFINFRIDSGTMTTDLDIVFLIREDGTQDVQLDGNVTVSRVSMSQKGRPFFKVKRISLDFDPSNLLKKRIWFSRINVEAPWAEISRDKRGSLNLNDLLASGRKNKEEPVRKDVSPASKAVPLDLRIKRADISGGKVYFRDAAAGNATFETTLDAIELVLKGFGTLKKEPAAIRLALNTGKGGNCVMKGTVGVLPVSAKLKADLHSLNLPAYDPYYRQYLNAHISRGKADISAEIAFDLGEKGEPLTRISGGSLNISDLVLKDKAGAPSKAPLVHMAALDLSGAEADLARRDIHVASVSVNGISTRLEIDKSGRINLAAVARDTGGERKTPPPPESSRNQAFHLSLDSFSLNKGNCSFRDVSGKKPVDLAIKNIEIGVKGLDTRPEKRCSFAVSASIGKRGSAKVSGSTDLKLAKLDASFDIKRLGLRQFQGYISRFSRAAVYRGSLGFKGKIKMAMPNPGKPRLTARGSGGLYGVSILDPLNRRPVFQWKRVGIQGLLFKNEPLTLHIRQILLDKLAGNIIFNKKGELNVLSLLKEDEKGHTGKDTKRSKGESRPDIRISQVGFKDCALKFVDNSVTPAFKRSIDHIKGSIKGLSSDPQMRAEIDIKGLADNSATMELTGMINPLAKPVFADLVLKSSGIGMTRFSPYTAKFLGYIIEKGKLSNQLHLVIKDDKVTAENRLFLDQFDFGHSVESKDAVNLPVKLAIALLKDRHGRINVEIPVYGRLDDPQFSLGSAIMKAIINIFVKAATSPFSLLSAIAGGGEDLQQIVFKPGQAKLDAEAVKKLTGLAKALKDRPALKVELTGYYDPETDQKGLAEVRFLRLLKKEKMKDLDDEQRQKIDLVDDVEIGPEEFNKYLTKAYKEAPFKKPRMIIGLLKKQPPEVMERMLRDHIKISESDLENLAMERAQAVQDFLVSKGEIEPSRIFLTSVRHAEGKGEKGSSIVKLTLK